MLSLSFIGLSGCANLKKQTINKSISKGKGFSKIRVEDKRKNKTHNLHLNYLLSEPNLNLSVTHPIGISLARLNLQANEFNFLSVKDRTHYYGEPKPEVLKKAFDLNLHPKYLFNLLLARPFQGGEWDCRANDVVTNCRNRISDLEVIFDNLKPIVKVLHPKTWLTIERVRFEEDLSLSAVDFQFSGPSSYKKKRL